MKKWTRAKKEAMMRGNFDLLHELSRSTDTKEKIQEGAAHPSTPRQKAARRSG